MGDGIIKGTHVGITTGKHDPDKTSYMFYRQPFSEYKGLFLSRQNLEIKSNTSVAYEYVSISGTFTGSERGPSQELCGPHGFSPLQVAAPSWEKRLSTGFFFFFLGL